MNVMRPALVALITYLLISMTFATRVTADADYYELYIIVQGLAGIIPEELGNGTIVLLPNVRDSSFLFGVPTDGVTDHIARLSFRGYDRYAGPGLEQFSRCNHDGTVDRDFKGFELKGVVSRFHINKSEENPGEPFELPRPEELVAGEERLWVDLLAEEVNSSAAKRLAARIHLPVTRDKLRAKEIPNQNYVYVLRNGQKIADHPNPVQYIVWSGKINKADTLQIDFRDLTNKHHREGSVVVNAKAGERLMVVIENNPLAGVAGCRGGHRDFRSHFMVFRDPGSLSNFPYPEKKKGGPAPADNAQCSPVEYVR